MCLRRYLVAVGGMALQQQWREQLDQALSGEDAALLEQEGVLEPAIPQPSGIRREAVAAVRVGVGEKQRLSCRIQSRTSANSHNYSSSCKRFFIRKTCGSLQVCPLHKEIYFIYLFNLYLTRKCLQIEISFWTHWSQFICMRTLKWLLSS